MNNQEKMKNSELKIKEICGDEFTLLTKYKGANFPIKVKHNKCNTEWEYKQAFTILQSKKCTCPTCKHPRKYTQKSFEQKIYDICPDLKVLSEYITSYIPVRFLYIPDNVEFEAIPAAIYQKEGYPFNKFGNTKLMVGINDLNTTHPEISKYLKNYNDGFTIKYGTNKKMNFVCPLCGNIVSYAPKNLLDSRGAVKCNNCSDGISYPEKILNSIFNNLGIEYIWQYSKEKGGSWCNKYRYDFYLPKYKTIVEIHGAQHYTQRFKNHSLDYIQENDKAKYELAINNVLKYIVIDAFESDFEYIKKNIINSELSVLIDLNNIDWDLCKYDSTKSYIISIGEDWDNGMSITQLAEKYQYDRHTIRQYLLRCEDIDILKRSYTNQIKRKRKIQCVETGQIFDSLIDAQRFCNPNLINSSGIGKVLNKSDRTAYGYHWIDVNNKTA